jgi:peptidoglycan/LPS O-acetylase OafA/YrhL
LPDWRGYAERRATRILPAYWVALALLTLLPLGAPLSPGPTWELIGLTQIYHQQTIFSGLGVAWSLCVEVTFYAALPLLARAGGRAIAALALASLALRLILAGSILGAVPPGSMVPATTLAGTFDWFALGMALAVMAERGSPWLARAARHPWVCRAAALGLAAAVMGLQNGDLFLPMYSLPVHLALGLAGVLLIAPVAGGRNRAPRALIWVGTISYGIYLWHVSLLLALQHLLRVPSAGASAWQIMGLAAVALPAALVAGALSFHLVERPAVDWVRSRRLRGATPRMRVLEQPDPAG